ncbi:MAG: phospho-sugar mutase, partial [Clostridia bacterium]|nr:phospho-sugar mutase [Clostridia bacterium]
DALLADGKIKLVGSDFVEGYLDEVQKVCVNPEACKKAGLKVIYTPLCGAGNKPVRSVLSRIGIDDVTVVKVQEKPDGNFPYAPYPNPEIREAFTASLIVAANIPSDILLATDPDSDRVGIAVRRGDGYELMTGNEVGAIMVEYLLSQRKANGTLPANPVAVKSIVTSSLADKIAADYGCEMRNVLTGFKYIGEIVTDLEAAGEVDRFIMGYEESYGYLVGSHARDKDAVVASMMICEMASYFKLQGKSLLDVMEDIYEKYGYYKHRVIALEFDGEAGMKKMAAIMNDLRVAPPAEIAGASVVTCRDYQTHECRDIASGEVTAIDLPASNVLEFLLSDNSAFIARPSGTEPKIKFYLTAAEKDAASSEARLAQLAEAVRALI